MKPLPGIALWLLCSCHLLGAAPHAGAGARTLLAVFAHPDDETIAGPLLARYAREGVEVHLALATSGDQGVTDHARIPAGTGLAAVREKETACACRELGARPPVLIGLPDGGLGDRSVLPELTARLETLIAELEPAAIVTWGPDGGSGHPDHRLVSAVVTEIVQARGAVGLLYYVGLPKSRLDDVARQSGADAPFAGVADALLGVSVPYTPEDAAAARAALQCHASQFTPEAMARLAGLSQAVNQGAVHLRGWNGGDARSDLFDR